MPGTGTGIASQRRGAGTSSTRVWDAVKRAYRRGGQAEARAIMSGFYFVALGTVALVMGRRRKALLSSDRQPIAWRPLQERSPLDHATKQY